MAVFPHGINVKIVAGGQKKS